MSYNYCHYSFIINTPYSLPVLRERQLKEGELVWDKDNHIDLDFVVATANLRCHVFSIPLKSKFDIKCKFVSL